MDKSKKSSKCSFIAPRRAINRIIWRLIPLIILFLVLQWILSDWNPLSSCGAGSTCLSYEARTVVNEVLKNPTSVQQPFKVSICTIGHNESPFIEEWILYHRLIGVEHFYVYTLSTDRILMNTLSPFLKTGVVTLIFINTRHSLTLSEISRYHQNQFGRSMNTTWWIPLSVDEYLTLFQENQINPSLRRHAQSLQFPYPLHHYLDQKIFQSASAILIASHSFINSGYDELQPRQDLVIGKHHYRKSNGDKRLPKVFFRTGWDGHVFIQDTTIYSNMEEHPLMNSNGNSLGISYNGHLEPTSTDLLVIYHYASRSTKDCMTKSFHKFDRPMGLSIASSPPLSSSSSSSSFFSLSSSSSGQKESLLKNCHRSNIRSPLFRFRNSIVLDEKLSSSKFVPAIRHLMNHLETWNSYGTRKVRLLNITVIDSVGDYSPIQGHQRWYYGYRIIEPSSPILLMNYHHTQSDGQIILHPSSSMTQISLSSREMNAYMDNAVSIQVIKYWIPFFTGKIIITGILEKKCRGGSIAFLMESARNVIFETTLRRAGQKKEFEIEAQVIKGRKLLFILDPLGDNRCNKLDMNVKIFYHAFHDNGE